MMNKQADILKLIIDDIENSDCQRVRQFSGEESFELYPDSRLGLDLSGGVGAFFIRSILNRLEIDEHHLFKWRLENKHVQYLIFKHYCSDCQPATFSLSRVLSKVDGKALVKRLFSRGFFLKAALGDGSGRAHTFDRTKEFSNIVIDYEVNNSVIDYWILQKKLNLQKEYRIHSFGRDIIYGLTFIISGLDNSSNRDAEIFLNTVLVSLPDNLTLGSLIGWDVGLDNTGKYYVIEANFSGFHPEYRRGFQTTGYSEYNSFGPLVCSWLNMFWRYKYGAYIGSIDQSLLSKYPFYKECSYFINLFSKRHFDLIWNREEGKALNAVIYWGNVTNELIGTLVKYLLLLNVIEHYYLIVKKEDFYSAAALFKVYNNIFILSEHSLFTEGQYLLINQLDYKRKKQICCYHALRAKGLDEAFMI